MNLRRWEIKYFSYWQIPFTIAQSFIGWVVIVDHCPKQYGQAFIPPIQAMHFWKLFILNRGLPISFDNDNSSATIKVWSNFHFSFSIILCLVQKKRYVQKIPMVGAWDGLNLDRSKLSWELFGLIQTFFIFFQTPSKQEV